MKQQVLKKTKVIFTLLIASILLISCGTSDPGRPVGNLKDVTDESRLEVIEQGKNSYTGETITKEELNRYIDESINAIDNNIPLYEKRITELEANKDEIINNMDFEEIYRPIDGVITLQDTEIGKIQNNDPNGHSIKGLKYINEKLQLALSLSTPIKEEDEERKAQYLEKQKQYVLEGHATMEQEYEYRINAFRRNITEWIEFKEYMKIARDQFGQESISLNEEQTELIKEVLDKNEKNLIIMENIIDKAKEQQNKSDAKRLLRELRRDMEKLDGMSETEASKIYDVEQSNYMSTSQSNFFLPNYKGIRNVDSVLADTITNSIFKARNFGEGELGITKQLKEYDKHRFAIIDSPSHYYYDKSSLLYDYTIIMIDTKIMIEEYNKVLRDALEGKVYNINNEFFNFPQNWL